MLGMRRDAGHAPPHAGEAGRRFTNDRAPEGPDGRPQQRRQLLVLSWAGLRLSASRRASSVSAFFSQARQPHLLAPITTDLHPFANSPLTMLAGRTFAAPARQCLRQAARPQFVRPAFAQVSCTHANHRNRPIADDRYHSSSQKHTQPLQTRRSPSSRVKKEAMYETPNSLVQHNQGSAIDTNWRLMA